MPVFCADDFLPLAAAAPMGNGRRPGHRQGSLILNRELELQILAPVIAVDVHRRTEILFRVLFQALFGLFVREHTIAFHDLQRLARPCFHAVPYGSSIANGRSVLVPTVSITSVSPSSWPTASPYQDGFAWHHRT
jgi:hypothetical protein